MKFGTVLLETSSKLSSFIKYVGSGLVLAEFVDICGGSNRSVIFA